MQKYQMHRDGKFADSAWGKPIAERQNRLATGAASGKPLVLR